MKNKENTLGANKQMAFLNTTKLAVLSAMLLLAVFCTIGMSFTPAEEGENIGTPNDSTYITGPRKLHGYYETGSGCDAKTNYVHEEDDATVTAFVVVKDYEGDVEEVGTVTLDYRGLADYTHVESPSGNGSKEATIKWTCGVDLNVDASILEANHKLEVIFTASEPKKEGYIFVGWYDAFDNIASESLSFSKRITIGENEEKTEGILSYVESQNPGTYSYTEKYYARYEKQQEEFSVRFESAKGDGSYTYQIGETTYTVPEEGNEETLDGKTSTTLVATANNDIFWGWYVSYDGGNTYVLLSKETTYTYTFNRQTIVYAKFIPSDAALFIIKEGDGTEYWNLNEACEKAKSSDSKVVLPKDNGTLYPLVDGELCTNPEGKAITPYTILSGVTLLVPYEGGANFYTEFQNDMLVHATWAKPTCFRKLTLYEKCTIVVKGSLNVAASIYSVDGGKTGSGAPKVYGQIDMQNGSNITIKKTAKLYCWGFITGAEGFVEIESEGTVCESLQIQHNPGGSEALKWMGNKKALFLNQYYVQNIESPLRINTGAIEKVYATMYVQSIQKTNATFIGSTTDKDALFQLNGGYLIRKYDSQKDRIKYEFYGDFKFNYLSLRLASTIDIETTSYPLPVTNNMTVNCYPDPETNKAEITFEYDVALLPGTEILIDKYVTANVSGSMFAYDIEAWKDKGYAGLSTNVTPVQFSPTCTYKRTIADLKDAKVELNGTLNIKSGGLINTTTGSDDPTKYGADVCSSGGGVIKFETSSATEKTYQYKSNNLGTAIEIPVTPAQLHNDENRHSAPDNYTQTDKAGAGDEFWYVASLGKWVKNEFGPELDIVDADNTNKTLTINANGWASSGWPYTINGTEYGKDDKAGKEKYRQADRTLVIPYTDTSGASLPIAVLDQEGKPICRHIYKVPFVYNTSNATLSGTDANSIVFVKSGTLSIEEGTIASAKEIYVAPGAELKVNGELDVEKLVLRTTPWQAAVLTIGTGGSIELAEGGQVYYSRIAPNKSTIKDLQNTEIEYNSARYYQFGLPLSCDIEDVTMSNTGKFGASNTPYGNTWLLKSYSESKRAENGISSSGDNWEALESTGTITAGVGYEMFSNSNYYREFYFPVDLTTATTQVSVQYTGGTIGAEHNGWNIITSPLTSRANVPIIDPATAFKVCWLQADGSYEQKLPTVIPPAIPFSCQVSAEEGTLKFDANLTFVAQAPRKQSAAEALTETEWVHLDIYDTYGEGDETSLFVHPTRFEQTYKIGIDVAKQSLTAARPIIYSTHAYGDMAFAGIADSLLENGIDLVVYSPSAQELTFSLRENKFLNRLEYLWLADNETGERTDLLMDDYTCRANAGTTKGRFVLNGRFKAPQISTGIDNTQTDYNIYAIGNNIAISGVEQGTPIYVFDAVGHMIYTTSAISDEVIVPAPCAGVYMLTIGGQTAKLVINK